MRKPHEIVLGTLLGIFGSRDDRREAGLSRAWACDRAS
jgi:hypothetical protein